MAIRLDRVVRALAEEIKVVANGSQKAYRSERQVLSAATLSLRCGRMSCIPWTPIVAAAGVYDSRDILARTFSWR